jgi:anaerobic magnesium-protoporphyrin IX monomethyl ester cyclase
MKIALVHPMSDAHSKTPMSSEQLVACGVSLVGAYLQRAGHEVTLNVFTKCTPKEALRDFIETFRPRVFGFSAVCNEYPLVRAVAEYIREHHPDIYLVLGGHHAMLSTDRACLGPWDAVCTGEGEVPMLELVTLLERDERPQQIQGMRIRGSDGRFGETTNAPFVDDLDSLPFMMREDWAQYAVLRGYNHTVLISRGCPFKCTYCSNHAIQDKGGGGRYVRFRSTNNIVAELEALLIRNPATQAIYLESEMLNVNMKFTLELAAALEEFNRARKRPIPFMTNLFLMRNQDWDVLFAAFRRANLRMVNVGLESGSERVRTQILKRKYTNDDVLRFAEAARRHDILWGAFVLVGIPGETREDFEQTVTVTKEARPDAVYLSIFEPYPGTDLHRVSVEMGLLDGKSEESFHRNEAMWDLPGFSRREIQDAYESFNERTNQLDGSTAFKTIYRKFGADPEYLELIEAEHPWITPAEGPAVWDVAATSKYQEPSPKRRPLRLPIASSSSFDPK